MKDTVATLWIGSELSWLERLSLKSFYDVGQTPILYTYDGISEPPVYAEIRDAREVMDERFTQQYWGKDRLDDPRIHADIFRVLLMRKTDHIWVDADVYALRPHETTDGYLFAARKKNFVPNGVVRTPRDSKAMLKMEEFVSQMGSRPDWWSNAQIKAYEDLHTEYSFETLPVGITGPEAWGYFLGLTGEMSHTKAFSFLYPVLARHSTTMLASPTEYDLETLREKSMSLHLYASRIRRKLMKRGHNGIPPIGSFLHSLCIEHDIDMHAHPIIHRDSRESAELRRAVYWTA